MPTVRESLLEAITAVVPPDTHVIPYQDNMDVPDRMTVMFKQVRITPLPAAPRGAYVYYYVLTIVSPALDPTEAETDLDAFVGSLLGDLDALDWFAWDEAVKVLSQGLMAYDVNCWNVAYRTPTTTTQEGP